MTLASSNHFTPTHNSVTTKLQPYNRSIDYIPPHTYQQHIGDSVYNPPQAYPQGYIGYPGAVICSAPSTSRTSQFEHIHPKVSCPMAKVAPYSAQVNRVVAMPTSSSSISADSVSYQEVVDRDPRAHMMQQQMKTLSLGEEGMYGGPTMEAANYSKWNGLIELKDQIMTQKDQLVERYVTLFKVHKYAYK